MKSETSFRVFFLKQHRKNSLKNIFFPSESVFLDFSFWPQGHRTWQNAHCAVVSESRFFNLETRMRVSLIQSRSSRRDREFLTLTLRLRDETEKKFPPISGIETRSRFIIFTLRLRDENENSLDLISFFETRPRILKLAIFPWNQAWTASLFCMQFLGG